MLQQNGPKSGWIFLTTTIHGALLHWLPQEGTHLPRASFVLKDYYVALLTYNIRRQVACSLCSQSSASEISGHVVRC